MLDKIKGAYKSMTVWVNAAFAIAINNADTIMQGLRDNLPGVSPGARPTSGIDTVTFEGAGYWNGRSGYRFTASATDAGEPGRNRDSLAITVTDAAGHVVASVNGVITSGNIQSQRINH